MGIPLIILSWILCIAILGVLFTALVRLGKHLKNNPNAYFNETVTGYLLFAITIARAITLIGILGMTSWGTYLIAQKLWVDDVPPPTVVERVVNEPEKIINPAPRTYLVQHTDREIFELCLKAVPTKNLTADHIKACGEAATIKQLE